MGTEYTRPIWFSPYGLYGVCFVANAAQSFAWLVQWRQTRTVEVIYFHFKKVHVVMWALSGIQVHMVCIQQRGFPAFIMHVYVCVHALLSYCPLHVPQLLPAWATDRQPDTTQARVGSCHGCRHVAGPCSALPRLCWSWSSDSAVAHPRSCCMTLPSCSTPSQLVNFSAWLLVAGGWWGAAATQHQCLWNEVKREVSPQPDPFCFHTQSLPLF